jgi:alpha-L-arabinofuranosidase/regulation of enolase protein 1 (concanavalin A-like superfamily)
MHRPRRWLAPVALAVALSLPASLATAAPPRVAATASAPAEVAAADASGVVVPNLDDVRGNVTLPTTGKGGSTLAWASSAPDAITPTGEVTRPAHGEAAVDVDLTVTATYEGEQAQATYTATVTPLPADEEYTGYFFPHFVGESTADGEAIYFAASEGDDPLAWDTLNEGAPVLTSELGTGGLRDPFLIRSPEGDRFFLIATDLKIYGGGNFGTAQQTGSRSIMVWESDDLVTWSAQREIELAPANAGNLWAPEAYWDEAAGEYVVYWASALYPEDVAPADRRIGDSYQRMMYATTRDFVTFSEPRVWIDEPRGPGRGMIDSTVAQTDEGVYHRLTKDEADMTVRQESSTDLRRTQGVTAGDGWGLVASRVGVGEPNPWGGTFTSGEGPTVFPSLTDDRWYMMIDQPSYHGGQGYMLFETADLASGDWKANLDAELPRSPRHGTVIPVTASEHAALLEAYPPAEEVGPGEQPALPEQGWVDEFDGAELDSRWSIHSEVSSAWSLGGGSLTLTSQPGDTWQNDNAAKNIFLVDVPAGDFTAVTHVTAPVSRDFQGAGLIAWQDIDNYVRAGLSHVSFAAGGPVVIETGVETAASYSSTFTPRPGSTSEWLRLQRTGDDLVASYADADGKWVEAARWTVGWDVRQVGLYALAAQNGTAHKAQFDTFVLDAAGGVDVVPSGAFTLRGPDTRHYLVAGAGDALALSDERPFTETVFVAEAAGEGDGFAAPITLHAGDRPVAVAGYGLVLGAAGDEAAVLRLTDAGAGKVVLRLAGAEDGTGYATLGDGGALVLGAADDAVRLSVEAIDMAEHTLRVDGDATKHAVSENLYGAFYEDINYAADGGLYAELVRNRSFEFAPTDNASFNGLTAWQKVERGATGTIAVESERSEWLNDSNRAYLVVSSDGAGVGVRNTSYNEGVALSEGASYDFTVWARSATAQELTVRLENASGSETYATATVAVDGSDEWKQYAATLTSSATTNAGRLVVTGGAAGTLRLDMVSLFPQDTWVGPVNGKSVLRKDLAQMVAELEPKFLRFPGGCVTNVGTFDTYLESDGQDRRRTYQWKETIGPVEERPTNWNFWGYNQSYGIGYLEYFEFAEDLGATPLPVVSVGANGCGSRIPEMTDDERIDRWVQDTVDLIEFANGDVDTEWGAVRAELGHPEPFGLKYIGLGNEENTRTFEANFPRFRDAIEAAYPDVVIISNSGPDDTGARFDELWEFNREQGVAMVDEHYYNDPAWFLANDERYDSYDREGPHVFLGEYASRGNTFANALAEAAYMTGIERNSDLVELASYAPMFANEDYVQWSPDMMWFDNDEAWGSVNYYTQKMFMTNVGDEVVPSAHVGPEANAPDLSGGVFLSTWATQAAYDDVTVTDTATGEVLFADTFADASQWEPVAGDWAVVDGEYVQSSGAEDARAVITDAYARDWSNYTLELTARKLGGNEGFLVGFAAGAPDRFFWWNLGGWGNTRQALERANGARQGEVAAVEGHSLETGREYQIRVEVDGRTIRMYLDGELQMTYTEPVAKSLYQVVTRDADTGELVVKVVNPTATTARTAVTVDGVEVSTTVGVTEMVAAPTATNTKANKTAVVPVDRVFEGGGSAFSYDFPAHSITFLRLAPDVGDTESAVRARLRPAAVTQGTGARVEVTATAAVDGGSSPAPTGRVEVTVGDVQVTGVLDGGRATLVVPTGTLAVGEHEVTIRYLGDPTYAPSAVTKDLTVRAAKRK